MKKGKPLLNKELVQIEDGALVWVVYERDGYTKWDEPYRIYREEDGSYSLTAPEVDRKTWPYGEFFESNYSDDPNEQAARDVHDGMFLFHVIED